MQSRSTTPLRDEHRIYYNSTMLPIYDDQSHSISTRRRFRKRRQAITRFLLTTFSILALFASFWSLHRMRQVNEESIKKLNAQRQEELNTTFVATVTESIPINVEKDGEKSKENIKHEMNIENKDIIMQQNESNNGNKDKEQEIDETKNENIDNQIKQEEKDEQIEKQQHEDRQQTDMLDEEEGGNSLDVELPKKNRKKDIKKSIHDEDDPERDNGNEEEIDQSARKDLNDEEKHINNENEEQIDHATRQELGEE